MGGTVGGAAGGAAGGNGLCRALVQCDTGYAGTSGSGTSTLEACVRSTLEGFFTLGVVSFTLGGMRSSHFYFLLDWWAVGS